MSMLGNFILNSCTANSGNRNFNRGIYVRHDNVVSIIEGAAKFIPQRFRARITMRLKHGQHAPATSRSRGFQRRPNLGGVMVVVVNKQKTIALIFDFKAATRVLEFAQRSGNFFKWNSKLGGEGDHTNGILNVVLAGNIQNRLTELLAALTNAKD